MCGILGVVRASGGQLSVRPEQMGQMRDAMRSRGPDGEGIWTGDWAILAHRRLAVVDLSRSAGQPMLSADGRHALVYNGELYNDADLRAQLADEGVVFRTHCDTETVLRALMAWGAAALSRFRGMFALGWVDVQNRRILLARDPLGIKPLYYTSLHGGKELVFASDLRAIMAHPAVTPRPDAVTVSAYLSTIRTVLGERTLFAGVSALRPGQYIEIDAAASELSLRRGELPIPSADAAQDDPRVVAERVRRAIIDSVRRHLRADVPVCALLSGGLDSTIIAAAAAAEVGEIRTYCSGARAEAEEGSDFGFARRVAGAIGSRHTEVPVTPERFLERWPAMVAELGIPLSTPNEVAIAEVASRLRADGMVVALSGEGADELFGGYEGPMSQVFAYEASPKAHREHPGDFQLRSSAWVPPELKSAILSEHWLKVGERDAALRAHYRDEFESLSHNREALQAHLCFQRRINLAGLLQRLDTATMFASVEGRTPFADRAVCALAESLPMHLKFAPGEAGAGARTKIILRDAFADIVPEPVLRRPKASFPLPFQQWAGGCADTLRTSAFARDVFTTAAIEQIVAQPANLWNLAWPAINLAMWGRRWWG